MKKIVLILGLIVSFLAAHFAMAQQGVITYEVKVNMHRRLPPDRQELKQMMPEFNTAKEQLFFSDDASLYKPLIEDDPEEFNSGGGVQIRMARPYNEFYLSRETMEMISKREFMGKNYLITEKLKIAPWKFSDETRTIQGYECKQAYYQSEESGNVITAWYTSEIRPFLGPADFGTLPGTVLALDINNEEQIFVATKVELRPLKGNELKVPKGGEATTDEEFKKMRDERIKQMGGHGIMIRN